MRGNAAKYKFKIIKFDLCHGYDLKSSKAQSRVRWFYLTDIWLRGGIFLFDLQHFSGPISSEDPCGADLEYDGHFMALSQAIVGKPEQQFGSTIIPAVEPDWRAVDQMATDLLLRTRDLRVVAVVTQAATRIHGVAGFVAGVRLMHSLCERYWDEVHPRMVIDGDDDPYLRINALAALSDGVGSYSEGSEVMRSLRAALLVSRSLPVTVRDVEMSVLKDPSAKYADAQIVSILADAIASGSEAVAAFEQGIESVSALSALIEDRMATGDQPDFSTLKALIKLVGGVIRRAKSGSAKETSNDSTTELTAADEVNVAVVHAAFSAPGEIRSREDVRRSLQRVCEYLERHEPSNPAALFARRAERMLGMGFLDIMKELSPDAMSHLQMLTGTKPPEDSY